MDDDLKKLDDKLAQYRTNDKNEDQAHQESLKEAELKSNGLRAGAELVVNPIVGTLIGLGLDNWLNTGPVFLIIFLLLGCGAGFWNVYKLSMGETPYKAAPKEHNNMQDKPLPNEDKTGKTMANKIKLVDNSKD